MYVGTIRGNPERIALRRISKANMTALDVENVMVTMLHWTEV